VVVEPVDPGAEGLAAHYAFEGDVTDRSGNGYDGVSADNPFFEDALGDLGQAMFFDGIDDYVTLPIGTLISTLNDITVASWVNFSNEGGAWQRIFDFGSGTSSYMFLCPRRGTTDGMRFAVTPATGDAFVDTPNMLASGWHHVTAIVDSTTMTLQLYVDGAVVASGATTVLPKDLGESTQNWLGRSQFSADANFDGLMADVRIYSRALSAGEVRYLAGDR